MGGTRAQAGRLVVCPTPIGNLEDITLRALRVLAEADVIACEDTRRTRVLLERHGVTAAALVSYHEHNERERARELVGRMREGATVALVSDAGMPAVSDPGLPLVRAAREAGLEVEVLPGPSAVLTALVASGMPAARFRFIGFLPRRRGELEQALAGARETVVAFESPNRLAATLRAIAEREPERPLAVCRELSKLHEEVRRGTARELAAHYELQAPRGEIVLVIGAQERVEAAGEEAVEAARELAASGARPRTAAAVVARLTGARANELYRRLTGAQGPEGTEEGEQQPRQARRGTARRRVARRQ